MASLGTEESGHCRQAAVAERYKQESMYGLSAPQKLAIVERWLLVKVGLYNKIMYLVLPMRCSFILSKTGVMSSRVRVFCPANPLKNENNPPPRPEDLVLKNEK